MIYEVKFLNEIKQPMLLLHEYSNCKSYIMSNGYFYLNVLHDCIDGISQSLEERRKITSNNYQNLVNNYSKNWCYRILTEEELTKFENTEECQDRLRTIDSAISILEGGVTTGETDKTENRK